MTSNFSAVGGVPPTFGRNCQTRSILASLRAARNHLSNTNDFRSSRYGFHPPQGKNKKTPGHVVHGLQVVVTEALQRPPKTVIAPRSKRRHTPQVSVSGASPPGSTDEIQKTRYVALEDPGFSMSCSTPAPKSATPDFVSFCHSQSPINLSHEQNYGSPSTPAYSVERRITLVDKTALHRLRKEVAKINPRSSEVSNDAKSHQQTHLAWLGIPRDGADRSAVPHTSHSLPHTGAGGEYEHGVAYALVGFAFGCGYRLLRPRLFSGVALMAAAATLEVLQNFVPGRSPEVIGFLTSSFGAWMGLLVAILASALAQARAN